MSLSDPSVRRVRALFWLLHLSVLCVRARVCVCAPASFVRSPRIRCAWPGLQNSRNDAIENLSCLFCTSARSRVALAFPAIFSFLFSFSLKQFKLLKFCRRHTWNEYFHTKASLRRCAMWWSEMLAHCTSWKLESKCMYIRVRNVSRHWVHQRFRYDITFLKISVVLMEPEWVRCILAKFVIYNFDKVSNLNKSRKSLGRSGRG